MHCVLAEVGVLSGNTAVLVGGVWEPVLERQGIRCRADYLTYSYIMMDVIVRCGVSFLLHLKRCLGACLTGSFVHRLNVTQ